jgi:hypothetical protein
MSKIPSIVACAFVAVVTFLREPLHSNDTVINKETHGLMGGIYEVRH